MPMKANNSGTLHIAFRDMVTGGHQMEGGNWRSDESGDLKAEIAKSQIGLAIQQVSFCPNR